MKGLLLKDLYTSAKYFKPYLLLLLVFFAAALVQGDNLFFVFYPCLICGMIPVNLLSYDERSGWDMYSGTLPCSRAQVVSCKYLIGLFAQMAIFLLSAVVQAVRMSVSGGFRWEDYLVLMSMALILSLVSSSITLPFMFKLGVEKGRMAYYVMIGIVCVGSTLFTFAFDGTLQAAIPFYTALPLLCLAAAGIYALSWYLSIIFYRKRDLH